MSVKMINILLKIPECLYNKRNICNTFYFFKKGEGNYAFFTYILYRESKKNKSCLCKIIHKAFWGILYYACTFAKAIFCTRLAAAKVVAFSLWQQPNDI
jgi:hypothetical protein